MQKLTAQDFLKERFGRAPQQGIRSWVEGSHDG
jgi:hypothetical protein